MARRIVTIWPRSVAVISEYTLPLDPMPVLQTESDAEINTEGRQDKDNKLSLFQVAKGVAITPNAEASVSLKTSSASARPIYMEVHQNLIEVEWSCLPLGLEMPYCTYRQTYMSQISRKIRQKYPKVC